MAIQSSDIRLLHRVIGRTLVYTSPDVPELHIPHGSQDVALANIQPALDVLAQIKGRLAAREVVHARMREKAVT